MQLEPEIFYTDPEVMSTPKSDTFILDAGGGNKTPSFSLDRQRFEAISLEETRVGCKWAG